MILTRRLVLAAGATFAVAARATRRIEAPLSITRFGAVPGKDALSAIQAAIAAAAATGGGTIEIPFNGQGGWLVSDCVAITASNVHIRLADDIRLTKPSKASVFLFSGTSAAHPLRNVSITGTGPRRSRIDGNARNMAAYVYDTADTFHSCVLFRWCVDWAARNLYGYNGLVNCLRAYRCGPGEFENCDSSDSRFDNGQSIDFDPFPATWCDTNPATWARSRIVRPRSWNCAGFGVTAYASTAVAIIEPHVWDCGNDDPAAPVGGGGISIEGNYSASGNPLINSRARIVRARIERCSNAGLFVTARGVYADRLVISRTRAAVRRANPLKEKGSNIVCIAAGSIKVVGGAITGAGTNGIMALGSGGYRPRVEFDGTVDGSGQFGLVERKSETIMLTPRTRIINSKMGSLSSTAGIAPTEMLPILIALRGRISGFHASA